ncbi:MAG: ThiF family adenylyltransferase, partial [Ruminococcus sp.]|nr:ThiF family adenylyltransferase [Ruminococcus sp.]
MIPTETEFFNALTERHGADLQKKITSAKVAVCGLGGLGSNIAIALARAGIGRLHIIDFDKVDVSNLNRQQYSAEQVGMYKTCILYTS